MNERKNKFLLAGEKVASEMHLTQPKKGEKTNSKKEKTKKGFKN